ncbi:MAG TPA: hypothetical protein EYP92_03040 [Candidatus Thioglobus sp.]|nr:hypothetical protein [Candidatus Thioglobus sp.]
MVRETYAPLFDEICTKVHNAKNKEAKMAVLRQYRSPGLESFLKSGLDPNVEWLLPEGDVPYVANEAPAGTEHTMLNNQMKSAYNFVALHRAHKNEPKLIGNSTLTQARREILFIQTLEGLHQNEAELLILAKDKKINKKYKGLTASMVCEAYGWNEYFEGEKKG